MSSIKKTVEKLLRTADIEIGGTRAWDIQVKHDGFYRRVLADGSMGLGESYMDGWWECDRIDELLNKIIRANIRQKVPVSFSFAKDYVLSFFLNQQTRVGAKEVIDVHYDLGNDLYTRMLDKRMVYTCGYWLNANDLDSAQEHKLDLVCRKLRLQPGKRVLDIGCGFGGFLKFAAEKYGITGTGITLSEEQARFARESCKGLPIEIRIQDYRDVNEQFDAVASIGMFEAVGYKNFGEYMGAVHRCLSDGGLFLLHTIGSNGKRNQVNDPWVNRYIFPNGALPTIANIGSSINDKFMMEDWQNFGPDYDRTLISWMNNFDKHWSDIASKYGDRFYRMWKFYLLTFAGSFRARNVQLWQIVLSKGRRPEAYRSPR